MNVWNMYTLKTTHWAYIEPQHWKPTIERKKNKYFCFVSSKQNAERNDAKALHWLVVFTQQSHFLYNKSLRLKLKSFQNTSEKSTVKELNVQKVILKKKKLFSRMGKHNWTSSSLHSAQNLTKCELKWNRRQLGRHLKHWWNFWIYFYF